MLYRVNRIQQALHPPSIVVLAFTFKIAKALSGVHYIFTNQVESISRIPLISVELILCYWSITKMIGTGWLSSTLILILEVVASSY